MGMTINTAKTKVMIKSKKINHDNFIYDNNHLEKVSLYKYLGIDIHHQLKWNYNIKKRIIVGWKAYYELENNCKLADLWVWSNKSLSLRLLSPLLYYMVVKFGVAIYLEFVEED